MTEFRRRFDATEIDDVADVDVAVLVETARDLEAYAESGWGGPSGVFDDRVMAAISAEPSPRLLAGLGPIAMLRQAWQLAWSGGRPITVRAQALALVLVALVAMGAVGSVGVVVGSRLLAPPVAPAPTIEPSPSPSPSPSQSVAPSPTPSPSSSPSADASPTETVEPSVTDDHGGGSDGSSGSGSGSDDNSGPGSGGSGGSSGFGSGGSGPDGDDSSGSGSGGDD